MSGICCFAGICNICGHKDRFEGQIRGSREAFACPRCRATLRYREQAAAILSTFGRGQHVFLDRFLRSPAAQPLRVLEVAIGGPFIRRFKQLPGYVQCYLFEDMPLGETRDGVRCEDLERLSFDQESFDLVLTSDVMEHVANPRRVIAEVSRVLARDGAHVFTVPLLWPLPAETQRRATVRDGVIQHIMEPHYHRSGMGEPSLVFHDFGRDMLAWHDHYGMRARLFRAHALLDGLHRNACVVATKVDD